MIFGVQYYPAQWPESEWAGDARKMRQAGVKVVRMGDLSWSSYEPAAGALDFSSLERAIALFGAEGIQTILCTASRTPPPWLYRAQPGILPVDASGQTRHADGRYAVAMTHPEFTAEAERIDGALIRHFAGHEHILAWQVDNEVGCHTDCYCDRCLAAFHRYLKNKYGTPEALNEAWGTHFWSFHINVFEEVQRPVEHPQARLEYRRFLSELNREFTAWRSALIRQVDPGKKVTTNFQNLYWAHSDYHAMARAIDVNGMNHYPARTPELALDYFRGARGEVWILEQQTHLQTIDVPQGWMRLWAWMAIAHGASAVVFFRWRQCRWGREQFGDGILPHSGRENRFYREFAQIGRELEEVAGAIAPTRPRAQVAITYGYDSRWAVEVAEYPSAVDPVEEAIDIHRALARRMSALDALDPRSDLSAYRLVMAPRLWLVDEAIAKNLRAYVDGGGCLCLTAGSGMVDEYGKCFVEPRPGRLGELAGIWISDFAHADDLSLLISSDRLSALDGLRGGVVADEIHLDGAEAVASYATGWRQGNPAITRHRRNSGSVVYVGLRLAADAWVALLDWLCAEAGVARPLTLPDSLSVYERAASDHRLRFLLNWSDEPTQIGVEAGWTDVFTGSGIDTPVTVPPASLRLLRKDDQAV